jgi:hypothetical protein
MFNFATSIQHNSGILPRVIRQVKDRKFKGIKIGKVDVKLLLIQDDMTYM